MAYDKVREAVGFVKSNYSDSDAEQYIKRFLADHFKNFNRQKKKVESRTRWRSLCILLRHNKGRSEEYQAEPRNDLLDYCRLWEIIDGQELLWRGGLSPR